MSKPPSGLFHGTMGDVAFYGDAEAVIANRVAGLDLREHPITQKQFSSKQRMVIAGKIENRTATREEYRRYEWDRRLRKRSNAGKKRFWAQERQRLLRGEKGSRNWASEQRAAILAKKSPKFKGKSLEAHHSYSVLKYPHLANRSEIIYPATYFEHRKGWHGGNTKKSLPGKRIKRINEF